MEYYKLRNTSSFDLIKVISEEAENSKLSGEFKEETAPYVAELARRLRLTNEQALIFAVMVVLSSDNTVNFNDIHMYFSCKRIDLLAIGKTVHSLFEKGLLDLAEYDRRRKRREYVVPPYIIDCIMEGREIKSQSLEVSTDIELLGKFNKFYDELDDNPIDSDANWFYGKLNRLVADNKGLSIIRGINRIEDLDMMDKSIILQFCSRLAFDNSRSLSFNEFDDVIPAERRKMQKVFFERGKSSLFVKKIVEHGTTKDGMRDRTEYQLTDEMIEKLMPDFKDVGRNKRSMSIITPDKIKEKKLFFDGEVNSQISQLSSLLEDGNFKSIQKRLEDNGFRKGFCALFYGYPGTGKTALAMELARRTEREIMLVDLSKVRNMWVGESEKNVQAIFTDYKAALRRSKKAPILVLNEADGLLTKRNTKGQSGVDKMENTMQNILLQNMEDFEGILIATTNLATNMDMAFERRFLYKIKFIKPSASIRAEIWRSMMPDLEQDEATALAERFPFTGGQIENVARKSLIGKILQGDDTDKERNLREYCEHEKLETASHPIGFTH